MDDWLGIHGQALKVREATQLSLSKNIANAQTPGYRAEHVDFKQVLGNALQVDSVSLQGTHSRHIGIQAGSINPQERNDVAQSASGSFVNLHQEKMAAADNNIRYEMTLSFLESRVSGLKNAFKGES